MAIGFEGSSGRVKCAINITPLVDVVLVLLVIFMVVTPMLQRGRDVRLPPGHPADNVSSDGDTVVLSLTEDRRVWLGQSAIDDDALVERLGRELGAYQGRRVLLKGDARLRYGDVRRVMQMVRQAGAMGVSLGVDEIKDK